MKRISTAAMAASSLAIVLSLTACGERTDGETVGQKLDSTVARTGDAANQARDEARTAVMGAAADTQQAASSVGQAAATQVDDAQITSRVSASLMGDKELNKVRIDVDTRDGVVTLSGPVPSSTVKARANEIAKAVKDVKSVNNQLTVSAS